MPEHLTSPFDGTSHPFRIGLKPLELADWIAVDGLLAAYLDEKQRLADARFDDVFAAEAETGAAQVELLALLVEHLTSKYPQIYRRKDDAVEIVPAGKIVRLDGDVPPLWLAAQLVQDDLVLMRKGEAGWRLAAGSLCFPSSWSLREKFGLPMHQVHGPVPGFSTGTRNADLIERMFDNIRPSTAVIRWNWSIYGDDDLYHPESTNPMRRRFGDGVRAKNVFLRVERQTLRKLPVSGDIVFTIGIHVDPIEALERHEDGARIAATLAEQVAGLDAGQLAYKGLVAERYQLLATLNRIATGGMK